MGQLNLCVEAINPSCGGGGGMQSVKHDRLQEGASGEAKEKKRRRCESSRLLHTTLDLCFFVVLFSSAVK